MNADAAGHSRGIAIYAGTFDPVHNGHIDLARRAARLFDHLVVGIYEHPIKALLFSPGERIELFRGALAAAGVEDVAVEGYTGLTVSYARSRGAQVVVRGLRTAIDFEYEYQMTAMNRHLETGLDTVYLPTSPEFLHLSSTLIKEVAAGGGALDGLVPPIIAEALATRVAERRADRR